MVHISKIAPKGMVRVITFDHFDETESYEDTFDRHGALIHAAESTSYTDKSGYSAAVYDDKGIQL